MSITVASLVLICFDIVSGVIKSLYNGTFSSSAMRKGGLRKAAEIVTLGVGVFVGYYLQQAGIPGYQFLAAIPLYLCSMELFSILENVAAVSPQLHEILAPYFEQVKENKK